MKETLLPLIQAHFPPFQGHILLRKGEDVLFEEVYGEACPGVPMTVETLFLIASLTKSFMAAGMLKALREQGKDVHAPLAKLSPAFNADWCTEATPHHLLTHTSGLPLPSQIPGYEDLKKTAPLPAALRAHIVQNTQPRGDHGIFLYNGINYILLTALLLDLTGESVGAYLQRTFFRPLGLDNTHFESGDPGHSTADELRRRFPTLIQPYQHDAVGLLQALPATLQLSNALGSGGMIGSARDLAAWAAALFRAPVFDPEITAQMTQAYVKDYSYGVRVTAPPHARAFYHLGGMEGASHLWAYLPDADLTLVILSNAATAQSYKLGNRVLATLALPAADFCIASG